MLVHRRLPPNILLDCFNNSLIPIAFLSLSLTGYIEPSRIASTSICCWKFVWVESCGLYWGTGRYEKCSDHVKCFICSIAGFCGRYRACLVAVSGSLGSASRLPLAHVTRTLRAPTSRPRRWRPLCSYLAPTSRPRRTRLAPCLRVPRDLLTPYWECYKTRVTSFPYYFPAQGLFWWFYRSFPRCLCSGSIWIPPFQRHRLSRLKGNWSHITT